MTPEIVPARREGHAVMEARLSRAARAARRLTSGPRPKKSEVFGKLGVIARVIQEMERVENALQDEGLDPDDKVIQLVYTLADDIENPGGSVGSIPCGRTPKDFFEGVDALPLGARFAGVFVQIPDHENKERPVLGWIKPFLVDVEAKRALAAYWGEMQARNVLPN